jgi:uncharacterized protein
MAQVLVDTSAVYALIDRDDTYHRRATNILRSLPQRGLTPLLTNFIVAECHALLLSRLGADERRAREVIQRYVDKTFSYTDATSFAVMERLHLGEAFAFDPHFQQFGLKVLT